MCINLREYTAAMEIINRQTREVTEAEYDLLKDLNYPVKQLGYEIKEKASS